MMSPHFYFEADYEDELRKTGFSKDVTVILRSYSACLLALVAIH